MSSHVRSTYVTTIKVNDHVLFIMMIAEFIPEDGFNLMIS